VVQLQFPVQRRNFPIGLAKIPVWPATGTGSQVADWQWKFQWIGGRFLQISRLTGIGF
jgi:hypothetical protein